MAKRDKNGRFTTSDGRGGRKFFLVVLVIVLVTALLGGAVYAAWHFTDGFKTFPWQTQQPEEDAGNNSGTNPGVITGNYYIETDGMKYGDGGVVRLASGSAFTVGAGFGGGYSVKFTARKIASDFSFTLGAEPYQWNNVAGDDFTEGFTITKTGTGFTVEFGTLAEIVSAVKGNEVTIPEGQRVSVPDKFTMAVTAANGRGISLTFTLAALGVELDPDGIIFGNETAEPASGSVNGYIAVSTGSYETYFEHNGTIERVNVKFDYTEVPTLCIYGSSSGGEALLEAGKKYQISVENNGGEFWTDNLGWLISDQFGYESTGLVFCQGTIEFTPIFDVFIMQVQLLKYPLENVGTVNFYLSIQEAE